MDKATLEAAAMVCSEMSYTAKYHFDPDGAWCAGANAATNNCALAILALADQAPVAPVETPLSGFMVPLSEAIEEPCKGCGKRPIDFVECVAPPTEAKKGTP